MTHIKTALKYVVVTLSALTVLNLTAGVILKVANKKANR